MLNQSIQYSKARGTYNLIVNNEWYYEGTYEECAEMMLNNDIDYYEQDFYEEEEEIND